MIAFCTSPLVASVVLPTFVYYHHTLARDVEKAQPNRVTGVVLFAAIISFFGGMLFMDASALPSAELAVVASVSLACAPASGAMCAQQHWVPTGALGLT